MTSWYFFMKYTVTYTSKIIASPCVACLRISKHSGTIFPRNWLHLHAHVHAHSISSGLNVHPLPDSCSSMLISFPMWMQSLSCCCLRKRTLHPGNTHSSLQPWPKCYIQPSHTDLKTISPSQRQTILKTQYQTSRITWMMSGLSAKMQII